MADGEDDFDEIDALDNVKKCRNIEYKPHMNEVFGTLALELCNTPPKACAIIWRAFEMPQ